ncbi:hypothetical protein Tco_0978461 [Tanacetum coccineum]|uniref:Uncharacterized protein n=1 Tax=Tanacetum coccineum TaxID=301880 RepID=A0ABQ5ENB0_9ASTR
MQSLPKALHQQGRQNHTYTSVMTDEICMIAHSLIREKPKAKVIDSGSPTKLKVLLGDKSAVEVVKQPTEVVKYKALDVAVKDKVHADVVKDKVPVVKDKSAIDVVSDKVQV